MRILIVKLFAFIVLSIHLMMFPSDQHATETLEYVVLLSDSGESLNSESFSVSAYLGKPSEKALDDDLKLILADYQHA